MSAKNDASQQSSFNPSSQNAVLSLPLSTNSLGGSSNRCKENDSGAKLNHLVRSSTT